ncbi:MAG: trigger factor [Clostridiales bacterium]|nr:trigger factor [Clostridiales bacterium]
MGYTVEKISGNQVKIAFEIASEKFDEAVQKAYVKVRGKVNVPGFRKGKAPRKLIESMYGEAVFYDDAFDILFPGEYEACVKENDIKVVDRPEVDEVEQIGCGKDLKFTVKVFVKPDVELGNYKGLKAVKYVHKVTDEEIDARINQDVEKATTMADVTDRAVENGDTVNLDYAGSVDGVAFEGGTAQGQTLEIGSGRFIPGFEEQMIGMNLNEEKDLQVKFPEEYHAEELKGKDAVFHVKVNAIQTKVKPELDDDFAADVSEFDTFAAYKESIVKELTERAEKNADVRLENELVQQAVDAADCDIPDAMIEDEMNIMLREMKMRMMYQGFRFEDYLQYTGQTEEQMKEMYRPEAKNRVKMQLVLEAMVKAENIEATEEDVEKATAEEAERMGREVEEFKASLNDRQKEYLKENAAIRKVVDMVVEKAEIEVKDEAEEINVQETVEAVKQAAEAAEKEEE